MASRSIRRGDVPRKPTPNGSRLKAQGFCERRAKPGLAAVVGLTLLLSGCITTSTDDLPDLLAGDLEPPRTDHTLWLDDDWGLTENVTLGDTRKAALGDFYGAWAVGGPFPEWNSAPLAEPMRVVGEVELQMWVGTDTVVTSTIGIFPDFVLYFGSGESVMADFSPAAVRPTNGQPVSILTPGGMVELSVVFQLPAGGIVIPAGSTVRIVTAPVMMETDANDLHILYGSEEAPSQVRLTTEAILETPWERATGTPETASHVLLAGSLLTQKEDEGVEIYTEAIDITNTSQALLVDLRFTGNTPFPDMDLYVFAPNGTQLARSVTPGPHESVHLYTPNLEAAGLGTYTIKVVNYVTPRATFDLTVTHLVTDEPTDA